MNADSKDRMKGRKSSSSSTHHLAPRSHHPSSSSSFSSSSSSTSSSPSPTVFGYLRNCISKLNHPTNTKASNESRDKSLGQRQPDRDSYSSSDSYDANSKMSHSHHHHHSSHSHHQYQSSYQPFKELTRSYILPSPNRSVRDLTGYR